MTNHPKFPVARRACLCCREKKIKCDGEKVVIDETTNKVLNRSTTICSNCKSFGFECVFVKSKRGGRRARKSKASSTPPAIANLIHTKVSGFKPTDANISVNPAPPPSASYPTSPSDMVKPTIVGSGHVNSHPKPSIQIMAQNIFPTTPRNPDPRDLLPITAYKMPDHVPPPTYAYNGPGALSHHTFLPRPDLGQFSQTLLREPVPMPMFNQPLMVQGKPGHMLPFQPLFINGAPHLRGPSSTRPPNYNTPS